jgi:aryl-alcohol dehydrogenase-like predicted oxidoreductase
MGVKTAEQLADNLKTADWVMLPEEVARLDNVSKLAAVYPYDFLAGGFHDK